MSFVRPAVKGKVPVRITATSKSPKKKVKKKKPWDSTNQDLTVLKATKEDIQRRKEVHRSQNVDVVKSDQLKKRISKARSRNRTPGSGKKGKNSSVLREVLFDQSKLHDALAKSDKMMAVVQDLFGDNPKRFRGIPNVTIAPDKCEKDFSQSILKSITIDEPSKLDVLSQSVMDKSALNDEDIVGQLTYSATENDRSTRRLLDNSEVDEEADDEELMYQPQLDLDRFRRLLQLEAEQKPVEVKVPTTLKQRANHLIRSGNPVDKAAILAQHMTSPHDGSYLDEPSTPNAPTTGAINDTEKVERTKARTNYASGEPTTVPPAGTEGKQIPGEAPALDDLKKVLNGLETGISEYEQQLGVRTAAQRPVTESQAGYTVALAESVSRLTSYLKESERRLQAERILREQLGQDVAHLQVMVDALTTDIISTQEEYAALQSEFHRYKKDTQHQIHFLCTSLNITVPPRPVEHQLPSTVSDSKPVPHQGSAQTIYAKSLPTHGTFPSAGMKLANDNYISKANTDGGLPRPDLPAATLPAAAALLLSPPRQSDSPRGTEQHGSSVIVSSQHQQQMPKSYHIPYSSQNGHQGAAGTDVNKPSGIQAPGNHAALAGLPGLTSATKKNILQAANIPRLQEYVARQQVQELGLHSSAFHIPEKLRSEPGITDKQQHVSSGQHAQPQSMAWQHQKVSTAMSAGRQPHIQTVTPSRPGANVPVSHVHQETARHVLSGDTENRLSPGTRIDATQAACRDLVQQQMRELQRQHVEAQTKIQQLLDQQVLPPGEGRHTPVSPPISPIPKEETRVPTSKVAGKAGFKAGITVALPQVDWLTNTPSPGQSPADGHADSRRSSSSPVHAAKLYPGAQMTVQ